MSDEQGSQAARIGLGRAIEVRRVHLGMKRKDLAEASGLSYPYISELENGGKEPSAKALRQIADALQLGVADLVSIGEQYGESESPDMRTDDGMVVELKSFGREPSVTFAPRVAPASAWSPPSIVDDTLAALVQAVVREEFERFAAQELPDLVARELQRALANAVRPVNERS